MKLFTSTALALVLSATTALAQSESTDTTTMQNETAKAEASTDGMDKNMNTADLIRTRDITGGAVYTMNEADDEGWDPMVTHDAVGANWNEIGEIEDLVLDKSGKIVGIVAEVGGFLDIGDKHVMLPVENLNLVAIDDRTFAYVTQKSEEELEEMDSVDEGFWN